VVAVTADWLKIKTEYINGGGSYRKLAKKFGVSESSLTKRAVSEKWKAEREAQRIKIEAEVQRKAADLISDGHAESLSKISHVTDDIVGLTEKIVNRIKDMSEEDVALCLGDLEQVAKILKHAKEIQMDILNRAKETNADGEVKIVIDV